VTTEGTADESAAVRRIVVGVDGSETSREALRWAADEAVARGAELQVVHAWEVPTIGVGVGLTPGRRTTAAPEGQQQEARQLVTDMVTQELTDHALRDIRPSVGRGSPASVLIDAARGADLLVVGSRGLGGFKGLLLGSVSTKMANHAPCPVVIVRPAAPQDD
jgi:nucleotide-binding universal stress UspA family protein